MADSKSLRVLVVDDDRDILELLQYNLEKEGFKIKTVDNSIKTIAVAKAFSPDLIILDLMMPHPNGIELCRELRSMKRFQDTYIFFLTAKSESYYYQAALLTGGDDYIEKMFGLRALTYKINSVLKMSYVIRKSVEDLSIGSLTLHRSTHSVSFRGTEVFLSKSEFELLFFFAQNADKIISGEHLVHVLWGSEVYLLDSSVELYIENLRKKTGLEIIKEVSENRYKFVVN
jgi:two-component system, OmpR family, alkaline phosphatase synthesis response regulator PhoP